MSLPACKTHSHETGLGSSTGTSSAGLCHGAANLSFPQRHPAALARPAADCSWLGTVSHLAGLLLCQPARAAGVLPQACGVLTGTNTARGGCGVRWDMSVLLRRRTVLGCPARALRGRAGSLPFPLPQRAPRVSAHGALLPLRGDPQPHAAAAKRRARRHVPAVRQGLLKSDTTGAAMSQFLSANGPGLVFPSAFLAACELAALAWRSYSLPRVRVCARFFLPSWAQLRILVLIPCKMT